jgi:two-component system chemotaxis sensor kinase CheA
MNEREFLKRLMATFKQEARELLDAMSFGLGRLESAPDDVEVVETVFRDAHSLKGAARAVNLTEVARHCHRLEDVFSEWKNGRLTPSPRLFDALHRSVDALQRAVAAMGPEDVATNYAAGDLLREIDIALGTLHEVPVQSEDAVTESPSESASLPLPGPAVHPEAPASKSPRPKSSGRLPRAETVRIAAARMDTILLQSEELLGIKLAATQRASDLSQLRKLVHEWMRGEASDEITRAALAHKLATVAREADRDQRVFSSMLDGLLTELKQALMLPVGTLLEGLPRLVRDLARDQEKEIELHIDGEQIEVDRRVLEELRSPLVHIVRNGVDHAIELPAERLTKGKPRRGQIAIRAAQLENKYLELRISDDGRGFDTAALRAAALRSGILAEEGDAPSDEETLALLAFHSGISTSPILTDVSGRGLGLAIVRNKVERLGGAVNLSEPEGGGAVITLRVPITLATFRGVLVKCGENAFLLPTHSVRRVLRIRPGDVESVEGREILRVNGEITGLARLSQLLGLPEAPGNLTEDRAPCALIVEAANRRLALLVDEVLAEQEVLVKGLGRQLARVRHIAGAAVLGTGALVPILYVPDLVHTASHGGAAADPVQAPWAAEKRTINVLLAEDSITARTLLKSILETAGYRVFPTVDGAEAWATLKTQAIDLVVSDIEMPRMNGFELTARIRADQELGRIPVILVTALESREDRERGIEAGANAYIVKSSFDQSNLFEAIQQLV